jgi:hypothetical protein
MTWHKGELCAAITCLETLGACCEDLTGLCDDGVVKGACLARDPALQPRWSELPATCLSVGCTPDVGACCDTDTFGDCTNITFAACNALPGGKGQWSKGLTCATLPTPCTHEAIPTVSQWGLVVLTLLLLVGAKVYFGRRQSAAA